MSAKPKTKRQPSKLKKAIKASCGCRDSDQAVEPKSKQPPAPAPAPLPSSLSTMHDDDDDRTEEILCRQMVSRSPKISGSIAVVKDSDDPCADFRQSMRQMIEMKGIVSEEDLKELLECFLLMNPPSLRRVIVQAFTDVKPRRR